MADSLESFDETTTAARSGAGAATLSTTAMHSGSSSLAAREARAGRVGIAPRTLSVVGLPVKPGAAASRTVQQP